MRFTNHKLFIKEMQHTATYLELFSNELEDFECVELSKECQNISEKLTSFIRKLK
jgi:hypothetical protein